MTNLENTIKDIITSNNNITIAPTDNNAKVLADAIMQSSYLDKFIQAASDRAVEIKPEGVEFKEYTNPDDLKIKEIIESNEGVLNLDKAFKANHVKMVINDDNRHEEHMAGKSIASAILDDEIIIYEDKYGEYIVDHDTTFDGEQLLEGQTVTPDMTRRACLKYLAKHLLVIDEPKEA